MLAGAGRWMGIGPLAAESARSWFCLGSLSLGRVGRPAVAHSFILPLRLRYTVPVQSVQEPGTWYLYGTLSL